MDIATLGLRVLGIVDINRASQALSRVARESDAASRAASSLANAARNAGALIAASLGGISFGRVIKETAGFEQSLLGLQVVSGATAKQMKELERQSRTLGATSMFSAQQAADAQNYLAMAGFNVNEVLSATPGLLELAAAGSMDLASAADLASNVLGGFRLEVDQLGRVNDVLAAAAAGSNTSIQQLGQAMSYAAPIAAAAGVSIEQTAAAIGVLSDAGLQGSRAGTGLLGVIRQLSNVTPAAEAALNAYGLTVADVNVEQRGLNEVLEALSAANINAADSFKIFGSEAGPAAQILASGAVRVNEFTGELELAEGAARRAAQILGSGLEGSFKSLTSAIGESTLQLGRDSGLSAGLQEVIDYATGVISVYNGMLDIFSDANDLSDDQTRSLNNTATALALAAGATGGLSAAYAVLTGAIWAANAAMTAFIRLLRVNPLVLTVSAVASLSGALYTARNRMIEFGDTQATISDWMRGAWEVNRDLITRTTNNAVDSIISAFQSIQAPVSAVLTYMWESFSSIMENIGRIAQTTINSVIGYWYSLTDVVAVVAQTMQTMFRDAFSNILGVAGGFWESIQAVFTGDLSFGAFNAAVQNLQRGFTDALSEAADEIQSSVAENLSRDYLGEAFSGVQDGIGFVIDDFKDLGEQISEAAFIARMSRNGFGEVAEGFSEGKTEAELLQEQLDKLNDRTLETASSTDKLTKAQKDAQKALSDSLSTYSALFKQISPTGAALEEYNATVASLTVAYEDGAKSALEYYAAIGQAAKNYNDAVRAADPNIKRVEELTRQYDAAYLKGEELRKAVDDLTSAYRRGDIDSQQYGRSIANVRNEMQELALAADPAAQELAKSWEEAAKRIDETFADAFVGAFDSFSDFADQLMSGFKRLLGELAYAAAKNQIMVSFGLGGSGQGQAGVQQGFSPNGINPGMLQNGYNYVSGLFGGGASSGAAGGVYSNVAGSGYTGALGNATSKGATLGGGAANGLYTSGAGFAGGYAGTEIGSSLTGKTANSNIGATVGATAGAYIGSIVPVIGTYLGSAIGGLIGGFGDSLFGSNKKTFDFDFLQGQHSYVFGDNTSAFGDYGLTDLSDYKLGEQQDALKEMLAALGEFDNQLAASAIPERFEAMKKSIEGFTHSGPEDLFETRLRTILAGSGALFADEISKIVDVEQLSKAFLASLQIESIGQGLAEAVSSDVNNAFKDALLSGADIEIATQQIMASLQALDLLGSASGRLNLQFDATAQGALAAAGSLAEYAGGLDNLAAIQQGYYQAAFSEAERLQHSLEDVRGGLNAVSDANVTNVAQLRDLVEAQDQNSEAGQRLALDLMALAPALQQTNKAVEDAIEQQYQSALGRAADADGLSYWFNQVTNGALTLEGAFWNIANSEEALTKASEDAAESIDDLSGIISGLRKDVADAVNAEKAMLTAQLDSATAIEQAQIEALRSQLQTAEAMYSAQTELERERYNAAVGAIKAEQQLAQSAHSDYMVRVREQRDVLNDAVRAGSGALSSLTRALGGIDEYQARTSEQMRNAALSSLSSMRGGSIDYDSLDGLLSSATAIDPSGFSANEFAYEQLRTANLIESLRAETEAQLSIDEQQLMRLDNSIAQAQRQHDQLMSAFDLELEQAQSHHDRQIAVLNDQIDASRESIALQISQHESVIDRMRSEHETSINSLDKIAEWARGNVSATRSVADAVNRLSSALKNSESGSAYSIPGFAGGGSHAGGLRIVGERGPELEYTGPSRIVNNSNMMKSLDNKQIKEELQKTRELLEWALERLIENSGFSRKTLETFEFEGVTVRQEEDA